MQQPHRSASPSQKPEVPANSARPPHVPLRAPLRPHELTPQIAALICDFIRLDGLADHLAGALVGVTRAVLEQWRAGDEGFALALEEARARFELGLLRRIKDAHKSDGTPDWRAHTWLLKNASATGFAKPARAAQAPAVKVAPVALKAANLPETPVATTATVARPSAAQPRATPDAPSASAADAIPTNLHDLTVRPGTPRPGAPLEGPIAPSAMQRAA